MGGSSSSALAIPAASASRARPRPSPIRSPAAELIELTRLSAGRRLGDMLRISAHGLSSAGGARTAGDPPSIRPGLGGTNGDAEGEPSGLDGSALRRDASVGSEGREPSEGRDGRAKSAGGCAPGSASCGLVGRFGSSRFGSGAWSVERRRPRGGRVGVLVAGGVGPSNASAGVSEGGSEAEKDGDGSSVGVSDVFELEVGSESV